MEISNQYLKVSIQDLGAQLQSIIDIKSNTEILWQGDPNYWPRKAPLLFPIIGRLKDDHYYYNQQEYTMSKHGFLRDVTLEVVSQLEHEVTYQYECTPLIHPNFPWHCVIQVTYTLLDNSLLTTFKIQNMDNQDLFYSFGGHPGFNINDKATIELIGQNIQRLYLAGDYFSHQKPITNHLIEITPDLFIDDALIFENVEEVNILCDYRINVDVSQFDYVGLWNKYSDNHPVYFVCVEPWNGIADSVDSDLQIEHKKGIRRLKANESESMTFKVTLEHVNSI